MRARWMFIMSSFTANYIGDVVVWDTWQSTATWDWPCSAPGLFCRAGTGRESSGTGARRWPRSPCTSSANRPWAERKSNLEVHLLFHLGHLADAFINGDLHKVHWSEERETTIHPFRYKALTISRSTPSPYTTDVARVTCYTMLSTILSVARASSTWAGSPGGRQTTCSSGSSPCKCCTALSLQQPTKHNAVR